MPESNQPPSERVTKLIGRLDEVGRVVECPVCSENNWAYGLGTVAIPQAAPNPDRAGLEALPLICRNCGYVRLHAANYLETDH
jgi:hypothetical protein